MTSPTHGKLDKNTIVDGVLWDGWAWAPTKAGTTVTLNYYFDQATIGKQQTKAWADADKAAYVAATVAWSSVANVTFSEVSQAKGAQLDEYLLSDKQIAPLAGTGSAAYHDTPQQASGQSGVAKGGYDYQTADYTAAGSLKPGGLAADDYIHELGHALGLKHPFNTIGSAAPLPGVTDGDATDLGDNNLAHFFSTIMSYNSNYGFDASGKIVLASGQGIVKGGAIERSYGYDLGPMALDIAAVQYLYGANTSYHTGNDVYVLPDSNVSGTGWTCIWDAGGTDELRYNGSKNCILDLRPATLDNSATGGGVLSYAANVYGGYTIANGVVIEKATGGSGNDTITGNDADNILSGNAGDDTISGGLGNDTLIGGMGFDTLDGGAGVDTVDYSYLTGSTYTLVITLSTTAVTTVYNAGAANDTLASIENVNGSASGDRIFGDEVANVLKGGGGDDTLSGGGLGASLGKAGVFDVLDGGAGVNTADFSGDTDWLRIALSDVTTTAGTATDGTALEAKLYNIQNVYAGSGNDTIIGNSADNILNGGDGDDTFVGGAGFDTIIGGTGTDTVDYSAETGIVQVDMNTLNSNGYVQVALQRGSDDQIYSIENIIGGAGNDTLTGDFYNNLLVGGAGYDKLIGGLGDDTLRPGAGGGFIDGGDGYDDTIDFSDQTGKVTLTLNGSNAATFRYDGTAVGSARNVEDMIGGSGDDTLTGDANDNHIVGGAGDDILRGGAGDDHFVGGLGADSIDGGTSNYAGNTADYSDKTAGISVTLRGLDQTWDDVSVGGAVEDHLLHIQNIIGGSGADTITDGSADGVNNTINGGAGADTISGGAGYDYIFGGAGNDTLDGGSGGDYVSYEDKTAAQSVVLTLGEAGVTTYARVYQGSKLVESDRIKNFENANGGAGNDILTGTSGSNSLNGEAGNDILKGGGGFDYFSGGDGTDTVDCSGLSTGVVLRAGGYYSNADVDGQSVTGYTAGIESVIGSQAADYLDGDIGVTSLIGGGGADSFVFDSAVTGANLTTIADFTTASDMIDLAMADFGALDTTGGTLQAKDFLAGNYTAARTADQHIIWNTTSGALYFDADGKGGAAAVQFGTIADAAHHQLAAGDIHVV